MSMVMDGYTVTDGNASPRKLELWGGMLYRQDTLDLRVLKEIKNDYGWLNVQDEVVLDIGANIGGFTIWALRHGAAHVIAMEPGQHNMDILRKNVGMNGLTDMVSPHRCACVGTDHEGPVQLWHQARGKNPGAASTTPMRGRSPELVMWSRFGEIMERYPSISVIKCDCEGAEYEFLYGDRLPRNITQVATELHFTRPGWRSKCGPQVVQSFSQWEGVRQPKIGSKNWTSIAGWRR